MSSWKVLFIGLFACTCFGLVFATLVVPLALTAEDHWLLWFIGLLLASICMSTLFALFLRYADRSLNVGR